MTSQDRSEIADKAATHDDEDSEPWLLHLYVAGTNPKAIRAISNIKRICENNIKGPYKLEVFDLYQQPELAQDVRILATPTLIKKCPLPQSRIIGDMADSQRVLELLNLSIHDQ